MIHRMIQTLWQESLYVMRCAIWWHLYNFKNVKNTHGGVLILVKLQASGFTFFKLYKLYQIAQRITYRLAYHLALDRWHIILAFLIFLMSWWLFLHCSSVTAFENLWLNPLKHQKVVKQKPAKIKKEIIKRNIIHYLLGMSRFTAPTFGHQL